MEVRNITEKEPDHLKEKVDDLLKNNMMLQCVLKEYLSHADEPFNLDKPLLLSMMPDLQKSICNDLHDLRIALDYIGEIQTTAIMGTNS